MKRKQTSLGWTIGATATASLAYLAGVLIELRDAVVFGLLGLAFAATAWMAIRILKDPYTTDKTFDDQFYQDRDDIRRNGLE